MVSALSPGNVVPRLPAAVPVQPTGIDQTQLVAVLLARLSRTIAVPQVPSDPAPFQRADQTVSAPEAGSPFVWRDPPLEVLAAAQDGGRRMMTSLLAFHFR